MSLDWSRVSDRIGFESDSVIARELGCSRQAVHLYRRQHGIESNLSRCHSEQAVSRDWSSIDWRYSDGHLHRLLGVGYALLARMRSEHGFPYDRRRVPRVSRMSVGVGGRLRREGKDIDGLVRMLGTRSDLDLSREFGVTPQTVGRLRRSRGIAVYGDELGRVNRRWAADAAAQQWESYVRDGFASGKTDVEMAAEIGCGAVSVRAYRLRLGLKRDRNPRYDWSEVRGCIDRGCSDSEIAEAFGIPRRSVYMYRWRHGIRIGRDWSEVDVLLGTMTDGEVGLRCGLSEQSVYKRRRKLGISAHGRGRNDA